MSSAGFAYLCGIGTGAFGLLAVIFLRELALLVVGPRMPPSPREMRRELRAGAVKRVG